MKIKDLELIEERWWYYLGKGKSIQDKFPDRYSKGYSYPRTVLLNVLTWIWLKWYKDNDICLIYNDVKPVIERAIDLNSDKKVNQYFREVHDNFLIQLAVLSGDYNLMKKAAQSVNEGIHGRAKQFYQSWTGILKYRILGDEDNVQKQHEIFQKDVIQRYYLYPTKKMIDSFIKKEYKTLFKAIKQRSGKFTKWAEKVNAIEKDVDDNCFVIVGRLNPIAQWPWVEAVFSKLAYLDGAEITYDSFWLPKDFVTAMVK